MPIPSENGTANDQPSRNAFAYFNEHQIFFIRINAIMIFGQRSHLAVIGNHHWHLEFLLENLLQRNLVPVIFDCPPDNSFIGRNQTRRTQADPQQLFRADLGHQIANQVFGEGNRLLPCLIAGNTFRNLDTATQIHHRAMPIRMRSLGCKPKPSLRESLYIWRRSV